MLNNRVGVYIYAMSFRKARKKDRAKEKYTELKKVSIHEMLDEFFAEQPKKNGSNTQWIFEKTEKLADGYLAKLNYGKDGFGSDLIDGGSRKIKYKRQPTDVEVIPLLMRVWIPDDGHTIIWAFQSFGRYSCVGQIQIAFKSIFDKAYKEFTLDFLPLIPAQISSFKSAPVKAVMLRTNKSGDIADRQSSNGDTETVFIESTIRPQRGKILGVFQDVIPKFKGANAKGRQFGGIEYDSAMATIDLGGKTRTVSLFGESRSTGLIDIHDDVKKSLGHPTEDSYAKVVDALILDLIKDVGYD